MKKVYLKRQTMIILCFFTFISLGIFFLNIGTNNKKLVSLKYKEDNDIDYKVYLKDNDFFDEKYIEKGKTYITSFIDYIHIDYSYNIDFDQKVNSTYQYQVVAKIEANKAENEVGNYWTKKYDVTKPIKKEIENKQNYVIKQSIDIDYNKYNEILNDFKKNAGISNSEGLLKVYLIIKSDVGNNEIDTPVNTQLMLKLPLSQMAIEATIDSDVNNNVREVTRIIKDRGILYLGLITLGLCFFAMSIFCFWLFFRNKKIYARSNKYELELKKILSTYDSIIVNTENDLDLEKYNIIEVESFEELIDAHSEIRMPINYYHTDYDSTFILLSDKTAWKYVLKKRNLKRSAKR